MDSDSDYSDTPTDDLHDVIFGDGSKKRAQSTIIPGQKRVRKCKVCQKRGHDSRNCPDKRKQATTSASSSNPQRSVSGVNTRTSDYDHLLEQIEDYEAEIQSEDEEHVPVAIIDEEDGEEEEVEPDYSWIETPISAPPARNSRSSSTVNTSDLPRFQGKAKIDPEVQHGLGETPNEDSFFYLFFTNIIISAFLIATNAYGKIKYPGWKNLEESEFKAFLAVILTFGIINYNNRSLAFENSEFGNAFIRSIMSLSRFNQLLSAWHYEDYTQHTADELKELKKTDPFWGVKGFVKEIARYFENCFNPGQKLDIDEQCIPWKGRHRCRCYNPKKPEKWHFKVFSLNDSETGYMCNFYLYEGSAENRPANIPATEYPFHRLLDNDKFRFKNHILFADNWYTSMNTVRYCLENGNHFVGTVKTNKRKLPEEGKFAKSGKNKKARGEGKQMQTTVKVNDTLHAAYFIAWMDKKPVHLLSTIKSYVDDVDRNLVNANGQWEKKKISQRSIS